MAATVALVLFGLRLVRRFVTARCGGNQCRLPKGGIAVTGPLGGVRDEQRLPPSWHPTASRSNGGAHHP